MTSSVIIAGARTPIGRLLGSLSTLTAANLGAIAIREAVTRSKIPASDVDAVIMGNAIQAGVGANPARLAAVQGGLGLTVPATTVNKVCLSGLSAIAYADQLIRAGQHEVVVAGGFESMTNAPHLLLGSRKGTKYGPGAMVDSLEQDALICAFDGISMGVSTERDQAGLGLSRQEQDEYAAYSHERAAAAAKDGRFDDELVAAVNAAGDVLLAHDEGVRPGSSAVSLAHLRPAFSPDGTITAGNASPLSDGAAAVVVMSKARAQRAGLTWLAEIGAHGTVAGPDLSLVSQPANAIRDALRRNGTLAVADLDLVEINEAFAGVALASIARLAVPLDRVNVNGGAIALGHPLGMSGARLVLTLAHELRRRGGGNGAVALCGAGGQGDALLVRVP
ncbi:MAG: acetyl-CoA C-acetyltransferase [Actinomycetota bacterium]|nr:acetyl-CoA C-acetyltransferase [Actinomycetota bacterium]